MFSATLSLRKSQETSSLPLVEAAATIGARIRQLRERAGIQSQELATQLGIDPSAMSNIERGKRAVKTEELALIAAALNVSPLAILSEDSLLARLPVAPRAQAGLTTDGSARARLVALAELHEVLAEQHIPSEPHLEDVPMVDEESWLQSADKIAQWARIRLSVNDDSSEDRFSRLVSVIERQLGVDVLVEEYPPTEIAGASITDRAFPFILVNQDQPTTRALFTLAHELAHVLSGRGDVLTLDVNLLAHTDRERFANAFAAAFLMPESTVRDLVAEHGRTATALAHMVLTFGVSLESLVYRLHNLRLINAEGRDQLRARGWTSVISDIDDDEIRRTLVSQLGTRPEQRPPNLLTLRAFLGYERGALSVRPLAGLLGMDADQLLDRLVREQDSREATDTEYPEPDPATTDEELYSESPV